ncbi:MAG: 2Fe-2S iron-sulfur cluster-binding protein [Chloroflexota bacterium]
MNQVRISIDGHEIKAAEGQRLLWAALDNGFYITNLCAVKGEEPPWASCRLCFVEVGGVDSPVAACTQPVADGMAVRLDTPKVRRLQRAAFELLLSHHHLDCRRCARDRGCALQDIARRLKFKLKLTRYRLVPRDLPVDSSHPLFVFDPNQCVLCGKCIRVCQQQGTAVLDYAFRGIDTRVSTFAGMPLAETKCNSCLACVAVCPTAALVARPAAESEIAAGSAGSGAD